MSTNPNEAVLETLIADHLTANGYTLRHHSQYDKAACVDTELLFQFLEQTQPKEAAKCKSYVRLYIFLSQIVDFGNPYLEQLYQFLNKLQHKLARAGGEDLSQGLLDNIDMGSYRLQLQAQQSIELAQSGELQPLPGILRGGGPAQELDALSNILKTFNERWGTEFTDGDKVRKMTEEVMQDVAEDAEFISSMQHSDAQNARITFDKVLNDKLINHINSNFEFFKKFNDDAEFRGFFAGALFNLMQQNGGRFLRS